MNWWPFPQITSVWFARGRSRWLRRRGCRLGAWGVIGLALSWVLISGIPAIGQTETGGAGLGKQPIMLDGDTLFEVGSSGNFSAQERANEINQVLSDVVQAPEPVKLKVIEEGNLPTIQTADGELIVTVTDGDVLPGVSAQTRAYEWLRTLNAAIARGQSQRSPAYRRRATLFSLSAIAIAALLHVSLRFVGQLAAIRIQRWIGRPTSPLHAWDHSIRLLWQLALIGIQVGLWLAVLVYITELFPETRTFWTILNSPLLPIGENQYSPLGLLQLIGSIVILWFAMSALTRFLRSYILSQTGADPALQEVISVITQYTLTFLGSIVVLQVWDFDVSSLTILASILGVGIGFGLQNIANNFISGLIITLERPIQVGDFVNVGTLKGIVERVGARSTQIRTLDRVTIIVPNSRFLENEVINWSHSDSISRLHIPVGVSYESDVEKVQVALLEAARSHPEVLVSPRPQVWFQEFGDSALNFELLVWTGDPKQQLRVKSDLNFRIAASFRRHGIEIPFPQRDLHIRSPQLEELISHLIRQQAALTEAQAPPPEAIAEAAEPVDITQLAKSPYSAQLPIPGTSIYGHDLADLATKMRTSNDLDIRDRRYRLTIYPNCFVGTEAVDWLMKHGSFTRAEAVAIGQLMVERQFIHHVADNMPFHDDYYFYRFYEDDL